MRKKMLINITIAISFTAAGCSGSLEFLSPGDMTVYDDKIYIIDQKNYRVQILDADLNYVDEIETRIVDRNDPEFVFQHIAVNKNGVYLNGSKGKADSKESLDCNLNKKMV